MVKIAFTNEKGNAIAAVRSVVRDQAIAYLTDAADLTLGPNGNLYKQIAVDETTGDPIYMSLSLAISMQDPTVEKEKPAKKAVDKEEISVPELF